MWRHRMQHGEPQRAISVWLPFKMSAQYLGRLRGWRFVQFNIVLGIGHIVVLSNLGSYAALVPHVAGDLAGISSSFAIWAATDFLIALVLGFPIARYLAGRFGDYRSLMAGFVIFALASFLCAISETLSLFLPARIVLGFVGGVTLPTGQTLLLNEYPDRIRSLGLAIWDVVTLMPIMISIPLGGWIGEHIGWRYLFYLNIPLAFAIAGVIGSLLYGRGFYRRNPRFDGGGFILLVLILLSIQTFLNMGNDFEWLVSPLLTSVLATVLVALPCFIIWETAKGHPALAQAVRLPEFHRRDRLFHPGVPLDSRAACAPRRAASAAAGLFFLARRASVHGHDPFAGAGRRDGA
jgi:MFS transporter, DHA2 family, multidrug resistance protein